MAMQTPGSHRLPTLHAGKGEESTQRACSNADTLTTCKLITNNGNSLVFLDHHQQPGCRPRRTRHRRQRLRDNLMKAAAS
jgi:hypothetical protein